MALQELQVANLNPFEFTSKPLRLEKFAIPEIA